MGLKVTITDNEDGTYTVGESENEQAEAGTQGAEGAANPADGEEGGAQDNENGSPAGQTVKSLGEALRIARDLMTHDAQVEDANEASGANAPLSPEDAKSEWDDQATKSAQAKALFNKQ